MDTERGTRPMWARWLEGKLGIPEIEGAEAATVNLVWEFIERFWGDHLSEHRPKPRINCPIGLDRFVVTERKL